MRGEIKDKSFHIEYGNMVIAKYKESFMNLFTHYKLRYYKLDIPNLLHYYTKLFIPHTHNVFLKMFSWKRGIVIFFGEKFHVFLSISNLRSTSRNMIHDYMFPWKVRPLKGNSSIGKRKHGIRKTMQFESIVWKYSKIENSNTWEWLSKSSLPLIKRFLWSQALF